MEPPVAVPNVACQLPQVSPPAPDGLTALHLAVLKNDWREAYKLLHDRRDHAVDERTSYGATSLMLACLFGRKSMFWKLVSESAALDEQDYRGRTISVYIRWGRHTPEFEDLARRYQPFTDIALADMPKRRLGRKFIWKTLRDNGLCNKVRRGLEQTAIEPRPQNGSTSSIAAPRIIPGDPIFLRMGNVVEIVERGRSLVRVEMERAMNMDRKTCGVIRGEGEHLYRAVAMSGWRGDEAKKTEGCHLLKNSDYFNNTRAVGALFGHRFSRNWLDCVYRGPEQAGAFSTCHAEKQLAVFMLRKSLSDALGTENVTVENVARLKTILKGDKNKLQTKFTIELQHKPCSCCLRFLELLGKKSGLSFKPVYLQWFIEGKRPKLKALHGRVVQAGPMDVDTFEDEIGALDDEGNLVQDPDDDDGDCTMASPPDEDDTLSLISRPKPNSSESRSKRQTQNDHTVPRKEGSAVSESEFLNQRVSRTFILPQRTQKKKDRRRRLAAAAPSSASNPGFTSSTPVTSSPAAGPVAAAGSSPFAAVDSSSPVSTRSRAAARPIEPFPDASKYMYTGTLKW